MTISAPARTRASTPAKLLAASASEMWMMFFAIGTIISLPLGVFCGFAIQRRKQVCDRRLRFAFENPAERMCLTVAMTRGAIAPAGSIRSTAARTPTTFASDAMSRLTGINYPDGTMPASPTRAEDGAFRPPTKTE
jgi:hypothetical protein